MLPLPHHPEVGVVQDRDLDRNALGGRRGKLLRRHLEASVAVDRPHHPVGAPYLRPDRRRHGEAHGPEATQIDPGVRVLEGPVLGSPHLMLAHARDEDRVRRCQSPQGLDDELGLQRRASARAAARRSGARRFVAVVGAGELRLPTAQCRDPGGEPAVIDRSKGPYLLDERLDRQTAVGQDPNLWSANLADLGLVYVHVHDLCSRCKGRDFAGHAVIKAAAERKQEVRLLHGGDSGEVAVHPGHPEGQGMTVGERATGHKGRHDGNAGQVHQLAQHLGGPRLQDAAARVDHRPFGRENKRGGGSYRRRVGVGRRLVAGQVDSVRPVPLHGGVRDVFREVDEHRSRATGRRDVECLAHDLGDIGGVGDEPLSL